MWHAVELLSQTRLLGRQDKLILGVGHEKLRCSTVVLHDGPDIYAPFNGVPAQGRITCSYLVEPVYSRQHAEEWFGKSITMILMSPRAM